MDKLNKGITIIPMLPENANFRINVQFMSEAHLFKRSSLKREVTNQLYNQTST